MAHTNPRLILGIVLFWLAVSDVDARRRFLKRRCPGRNGQVRDDCYCGLYYTCETSPTAKNPTLKKPTSFNEAQTRLLLDLTTADADWKRGVYLTGPRQLRKQPEFFCKQKCMGRARSALGGNTVPTGGNNRALGQRIAARLLHDADVPTGSCCAVYIAGRRDCFKGRSWGLPEQWETDFRFWRYSVASTATGKSYDLFSVAGCEQTNNPFTTGLKEGPTP